MFFNTIMNCKWSADSEKYPIALIKYAYKKSYDPVFEIKYGKLRSKFHQWLQNHISHICKLENEIH